MLLKQLYYKYYNIRPKSASKGVTVVCFHPIHYKHLNTMQLIEMTIVTPNVKHSTMHSPSY
jgi:hypothetical protein